MNLWRLTPACRSHEVFANASDHSFLRLRPEAHQLIKGVWYHDDPADPMFSTAFYDDELGNVVLRGAGGEPFLRTPTGIASEICFWKRFVDAELVSRAIPQDEWVCIMDADTYFGSPRIFELLDSCTTDILGTGIDDTYRPLHLSGGAVFIRAISFALVAEHAWQWLIKRGVSQETLEQDFGVPYARDAILGFFCHHARLTRTLLSHDEWYTGHTYEHLEQFARKRGFSPGSLFYHVHVGRRRDKGLSLMRELQRPSDWFQYL